MAAKLRWRIAVDERSRTPGTCVDCGSDAFIQLAPQDGRDEMICGHCYGERLRKQPLTPKKVRRADPDLKLPRAGR